MLLEPAVVNISYFQSCHFLDIKALLNRQLFRHLSQGVEAVHSAKDRLALHMKSLGVPFAH